MGMSIKEASEQLGIPAHTIRHYEKEGLIPFLRRDEHGNRIFKSEDVEWIKLMTCFRVTGMPINQLKRIVDLALQGESTLESRKQILEQHKEELNKRQRELDLAFEAVNRKLERYREIQNGTIDEETAFRME